MYFISPTKGRLHFSQVIDDIVSFMEEDPSVPYKLIIGSDSQVKDKACFVTAIIVHRVGKGGRYFYRRKYMPSVKSLRHKIFTETSLSLEVASYFQEELKKTKYKDIDFEVHVDIGQNGDTKELIREVAGWVMGSGYKIKIKPVACGASKVADKYTK
jgi:predicted RNase H-related nuclease YkuK (DUF458 family)